jgi:hypothetical protein
MLFVHGKGMTVGFTPYRLPDGGDFIPDLDCVEHPEILNFVRRFPDYYYRDCIRCGLRSAPTNNLLPAPEV